MADTYTNTLTGRLNCSSLGDTKVGSYSFVVNWLQLVMSWALRMDWAI